MDATQLSKLRRQLRRDFPVFGRWMRCRAVKALAINGSSAAVRLLAETFSNHTDSHLRNAALTELQKITSREAIDAACAVWQQSRDPGLTALLTQCRWLASTPVELRILTALKTGQANAIKAHGRERIEPLVRACHDTDPQIAAHATLLLAELKDQRELELFCDLVMRNGQAGLRKLALEKGFAPRDSGRRALFYFLTGQMERFDALDFDQSLLRASYEASTDDIRQAVAGRVRSSGRPELAQVLQGGHEKKHLATMGAREWETVITVLASNRRYDDLWALVFEAPPEWSAESLGLLKQAAYKPRRGEDQTVFDRLIKLRPAEGRDLKLFLPIPTCRPVIHAHDHGTRSLAFSPDGKTLASGSNDTTARVWELQRARLRMTLSGRPGSVLALAFSPDGKMLAAGRGDHSAQVWENSTWEPRSTLAAHTDRLTAVGFSPDVQSLATGSLDGTARIWDLRAPSTKTILTGHTRGILTLAFSPDGSLIATGSHDGTAILWFVASGQCKSVLSGHAASVLGLAFSPGGKTLVTGSADGAVRFWSVANGEFKAALPEQRAAASALAFSPDGKRLATGNLDRTVRVWDLNTGQLRANLQGHADEINALAFSPDGKTLASGSRDKTIRLWELASAKPLITMARHDLDDVQKWAEVLANPDEARGWHFVAALLRHRFRFDIELSETVGKVLEEFDIEIEDVGSPRVR